jgi:hypothetical protein
MDLHSGSPWETLTLTTLSTSRHLFPILLSEARSLAEEATEGKTVVYTAWGVEWRPFGKPRRRREMGSVVLAEGVAERVEKDLKGFLGRGKWYAERGESDFQSRRTVLTFRYPVSPWVFVAWPTWIWKDIVHPGVGRIVELQHLPPQSRREGFDRR